MAIKSFSSGEILTASDTNSYLNNGGLVYISGGTLSGAATNFASVFNSTYRDYRVVLTGSLSAATDFCVQFLVGTTPTTTSYWYAYTGLSGGNAAANQNGQNTNPCRTGASATGAGDTFSLSMDVFAPNIASVTYFTAQSSNQQSDDFRARSGAGSCNVSTQFDGIRFLSAGGQTISGTVKIYGYRQP